MLNLTATKPQLKVVFDQCGTPTYAWDLAAAIVKALETVETSETPETFCGVYHYSNEGVCSWFDFTKMIQQIAIELGTLEPTETWNSETHAKCVVEPCHSNEFPSPVTRPAYSVLDKTKIKDTYQLNIPYWTDSLRKCIINIKNNK